MNWDPLLEGLSTDTMTFIEAVFRAEALAWGQPNDFLIVEEAGKPIGGASGFTMDSHDYRPLRLERMPMLAAALAWTDDMLAQFQQGYESVWHDPLDTTLAPSAPWIIECVAVLSEARGRGVAKRLIGALLDEGRQRGFSHAGISVTLGNDAAQRVYESVVFQMYVMYGAEYFEGEFPGTLKYRLSLK